MGSGYYTPEVGYYTPTLKQLDKQDEERKQRFFDKKKDDDTRGPRPPYKGEALYMHKVSKLEIKIKGTGSLGN